MSSVVPVPATAGSPPVGAAAPAAAVAVSGAAPAAGTIAVSGQALPVTPGQALAARVIAIQAGMVELALAGGLVTAASDLPLEPGQTLRLVVDQAGAERVTLRIAPETATAQAAPSPSAGPAAALADAGVPAPAASALLAALAERGVELPTGAAAATLAARAAAAGVATPSQAAAFARLLSSGLPTTPAAVAGLAQLIDGAPLGRALTTLLDAATARVAATATPAAETTTATSSPTPAAPSPSPAALAGAAPGRPAGTSTAAGFVPLPTSEDVLLLPQVPSPAARAVSATAPVAAPATATPPAAPSAAPFAGLVQSLTDLARSIESGAVDGRPQALRHALAELGIGLEARLAAGSAPDHPPLRALLLALADHPAADPSLGRAAAGLSDALTAQGLVGPTLGGATAGANPAAPTPDAANQNGAYLQVPLPGGGTAEVRVAPDDGHDGETGGSRPRRLAFLLHLSALGPVMIDASAGAAGVDATIRVGSDAARSFLDTQAADLATALRRPSAAASVRVERMAGPAPERLLAPPPSSGLDLSA